MQLDGAAVLVTGAASGLGYATARTLHEAGAAVALVDVGSEAGEKATAELGERALFAPADVTDSEQVEGALEAAASLGPLRAVVNCAGIGTPGKVLSRRGNLPLEVFERVVRVNLLGSFNVVRLAAARMAEVEPQGDERGVIVNTASVAAFDGQVGQAAYAASKGGVVGMTLPLAREFADHRIRVVAIAPGLFRTPMFDGLDQRAIESLEAQVPHPSRLGEPAEFASLVRHVIENPMLNGETIRLDGSIRMAPR